MISGDILIKWLGLTSTPLSKPLRGLYMALSRPQTEPEAAVPVADMLAEVKRMRVFCVRKMVALRVKAPLYQQKTWALLENRKLGMDCVAFLGLIVGLLASKASLLSGFCSFAEFLLMSSTLLLALTRWRSHGSVAEESNAWASTWSRESGVCRGWFWGAGPTRQLTLVFTPPLVRTPSCAQCCRSKPVSWRSSLSRWSTPRAVRPRSRPSGRTTTSSGCAIRLS